MREPPGELSMTDEPATPRVAEAGAGMSPARRCFAPSVITAIAIALASLAAPFPSWGARRGSAVRPAFTAEALLAGTDLGVSGEPTTPLVAEAEVLAVSPEMRAFLDAHVNRASSDSLKLHQLASAIIAPATFGVEYDDTTRTAAEAFSARRGNCLSFSSMFVALAREVGLDVLFQEVEVPPDWTLDNDTFVLNRHVNVYVDLGSAGKRVVDFNIADFKASYEMHKISDTRARAHYYNNIGVARMQAGDSASALACFRRAIADNDAGFAAAWTNLATLYQRRGLLAHAEAAYLEALKTNRWDLVAMSNLARLYERMGDRQRAATCQKKVAVHRMRNPYYRYSLALASLAAGDTDAAVRHLKFAIRKRPKEDQFYLQLGLTYLKRGDEGAAQRWLARAEEVAATDDLKRRYARKIDALLRQSASHHR